jgi:hypothetical protein
MAVTFVNAGTAASGLATITPGLPASIVAGDYLLMVIHTSNQAASISAGGGATWTNIGTRVGSGVAGSAGTESISLFQAFAVSGQTAPTVADSGDHQLAQIWAFRGTNGIELIQNTVTGQLNWTFENVATATAVTIPAITTWHAGCMIIGVIGNAVDSATVQVTSMTNATLASVTMISTTSTNTTSGTGGGFQAAFGILTNAGSSGSFTATQATTSIQSHFTIPLVPIVPSVSGYSMG